MGAWFLELCAPLLRSTLAVASSPMPDPNPRRRRDGDQGHGLGPGLKPCGLRCMLIGWSCTHRGQVPGRARHSRVGGVQ